MVKKQTPAPEKAKPAVPAEESVDKAKAETVESAKAQEETAVIEKEETRVQFFYSLKLRFWPDHFS